MTGMRPLILALALALPAAAAASVPTLAVTNFDNHTSEARFDPLGHGLADMLITDLSAVSGLQVVERGRLAELMKELELQSSSFVDPSTAVEVGKGLGAQYVLTGAFAAVDPSMRIDARIVNVATGEVVQADSVTGAAAEFFLLEKELATQIVGRLGVSVSARENARMGRVATESFDAFLAYSAGLEAMDRGALDEARDKLNAALEADDRFALATDALNDLEERLRAHRERGRAAMSAYAADTLKNLEAIEASGDLDALDDMTLDMQVRLTTVQASPDILVVAGKLIDMKLPEDRKMGGEYGVMSVNEWALGSYTVAAYAMGMRADVLTYGEEFLKRYPGSASYGYTVGAYVNLVINQTRKEEAGRDQIPKIEATARVQPLQMGCIMAAAPAVRAQQCEAWVVALDEVKDLVDPVEDPESSWGRAALAAGDVDAIERALAHAKARDRYSRAVEDLSGMLADARERAAAAEAAARTVGSASTPAQWSDAARALILGGRADEAFAAVGAGLDAFPTDNGLHALAIELAVANGDVAAAEAALAAWEAAEARGATVDPGTARSVRELAEMRAQADDAMNMGPYLLASGYATAGQAKLAGDAYVAMADAGIDPALSLSSAGGQYYSGLYPVEARAAYERLLDEFPDTAEAALARSVLESIP